MIEKSANNAIDAIAGKVADHRTALTIIGGIWFWAGIAIYARFIALPEFLEPLRQPFFWSSVAFNATWWAIIQPRVEKLVKKRQLEAEADQRSIDARPTDITGE